MSKMLSEKRSTRGLRMTELIGQAMDEDEEFYNNDIWNEDSDEESFEIDEVEEKKPDQFDSDFNDTETEDEEDDDSINDKKLNKSNKKETVKANIYKDPTMNKQSKRIYSHITSTVKESKRLKINETRDNHNNNSKDIDGGIATERNVRNSTKLKTIDMEVNINNRIKYKKISNDRLRKEIKTQHYQKDLLLEALDTEDSNNKWLIAQNQIEIEKNQHDKLNKNNNYDNSYIRFLSKKGCYNTITFNKIDDIPSILLTNNEYDYNILSNKNYHPLCVITNLPAKYKDPITLLPYANLNAYKQIKEKYHK